MASISHCHCEGWSSSLPVGANFMRESTSINNCEIIVIYNPLQSERIFVLENGWVDSTFIKLVKVDSIKSIF